LNFLSKAERCEIVNAVQIYFEELSCGDSLPLCEYGPLTVADTVRWAGLQENWSQLHFDRDYVRQHNGLRTFIASGAYREALLLRMLAGWVGPRGRVQKISLRHTYSTFEGDRILYGGKITGKSSTADDPWIQCEIDGTNQERRQIVSGSCVLIVPSNKERT
jgi:acyl dehydratase